MKAFLLSLLLFASIQVEADYVYEANQPLYDLQTNSSGATGLGSNDDSVSAAFDLGFTFTFYGNDFTQARMATNGCLHFNLTGSYCGDYTPDPLPQYTNTLFPFWTDLIKDGGSAMKAKAFDDYTIFGWYKMREYNRANSDNSLEVWLYPNNTYEFRYGELDIISHDVLIGEQGSTSQIYTYHFFDECNTGTTNISGTCVSYDWNSSSNAVNTLLEDGGSLYGDGTNQSLCATIPLTSVNCSGYAVAYFTQQCDLSALYDDECTGYPAAYLLQQCNLDIFYSVNCVGYANALFDSECDDDPQFSPSCPGYLFEQSAAYFVEEQYDYGYEEFDYYEEESFVYEDEYSNTDGYEEVWDDDPYANMEFTDEEWYEIDLEEFGQEQVDDWYGTEVSFDDEGLIVWEDSALESWDELDLQMDEYDAFVEIYEEVYYEEEYFDPVYEEEFVELTYTEEEYFDPIYEEEFIELVYIEEEIILFEEFYEEPVEVAFEYETEYETPLLEDVLMQNFEHEQIVEVFYEEEPEFLEFETIEELDEWFEEEMEDEQQEEEILLEELADEALDEDASLEDSERLAEEREEIEESIEEEEFEVVAREDDKGDKREMQLNVVANTVRTATNSMSGTTSGTSMQTTGNSVASGGVTSTTATAVASSASGGGMSISSSPSISAQFTSATAQTQTLLDMSSMASTGGSISTDMTSFDSGTTSVVSADTSFSSDVASFDSGITSVASSGSSFSTDATSVDSDSVSTVDTGASVETEVASGEIEVTVADAGSSDTTSGSSSTSSVSVSIVPMQTLDGSSQVVMAEVQVQNMQGEIDTAVSGVMTASEADQVADKIIAQNIKEQQEEQETEQQQTGKYADSTTLIAYMGYVPGFNAYSQAQLPQADSWYEPKTIYGNVLMSDNVQAFYGMYADNLNGMNSLINMQPKL